MTDRDDIGGGCGIGAPVEPELRTTFSQITSPETRARILWRESVVQAVLAEESTGRSRRQAVQAVRMRAEFGAASRSAAFQWVAAYKDHGIDGLVDQKAGRCGRKAIAASIPQNVIDAAAAKSIEYGTLGVRGEQNMARAVRDVITFHPDTPAAVSAVVHGGHASKSYVPYSIRRVLRVSPLARAAVQGPRAAALASPHAVCIYDAVPAGRVVTGDDLTANVYCWVEFPGPLGYLVGRPQVLALLDVGSLRWLTARVIMRQSGGYTRDDVWGLVGDCLDTYGVYPEWLFEGGNLWRSNKIIGEHTGTDEESRFGGLRSLGCILRHSLLPRSKPIEERFNQLQYAGDNVRGFCGRAERYDRPEAVADLVEACKAGKVHPRGQLLHISEYREHLTGVMGSLNSERNDGKTLRGQTPDEKWAADSPVLSQMPESAKWLYRSQRSLVTVLRNGMVHVTDGTGKFKEDHYYRHPGILQNRAGQRVIVYWDDRRPQADCAIMTAANPPHFLGMARYAQPIPRFDASKEQLHAEYAERKAAAVFSRSEVARLQPYFDRVAPALQSPGELTAPAPVSDPGTVRDVGRAIRSAADQVDNDERILASARAAMRSVRVTDEDLATVLATPELESTPEVTEDEINRLFASEPADRPIDFAEAFAAANAEKPQPQQSWGTNDHSDSTINSTT